MVRIRQCCAEGSWLRYADCSRDICGVSQARASSQELSAGQLSSANSGDGHHAAVAGVSGEVHEGERQSTVNRRPSAALKAVMRDE